jgi:hypothetical protein
VVEWKSAEPVEGRDRPVHRQLVPLGIEKGNPFAPDKGLRRKMGIAPAEIKDIFRAVPDLRRMPVSNILRISDECFMTALILPGDRNDSPLQHGSESM